MDVEERKVAPFINKPYPTKMVFGLTSRVGIPFIRTSNKKKG